MCARRDEVTPIPPASQATPRFLAISGPFAPFASLTFTPRCPSHQPEMIDRHYGHLARDGRDAQSCCSTRSAPPRPSGGRWWTLRGRRNRRTWSTRTTETSATQEESGSPLTDSNRRPPPYHGAVRAYTRG